MDYIYAIVSCLAGYSVYLSEVDPSKSNNKLIRVPQSDDSQSLVKTKDRLYAHMTILNLKFFVCRYICSASGFGQGIYLILRYHFRGNKNESSSTLAQRAFIINLITCFSAIFRIWCFHTLQKSFTYKLKVTKDQKLIKSGPYTFLIHPSYTGLMLTNISILFGLLGPFNVLLEYFSVKPSHLTLIGSPRHICLSFTLTCALISNYWFWFFMVKCRIPDEESMLLEHFGKEYEEFISKRWRIIPFVY